MQKSCPSPGIGYYTKAVCATPVDEGTILPCPVPSVGSYTTSVCIPGTSATLGTPSVVKTCSTPAVGSYVTKLCISGDSSTVGSDTVTKSCSTPPSALVITAPCNPGEFNSLGWDATFASFEISYLKDVNGVYKLCPAGSFCKDINSIQACKVSSYCKQGSFVEVLIEYLYDYLFFNY